MKLKGALISLEAAISNYSKLDEKNHYSLGLTYFTLGKLHLE